MVSDKSTSKAFRRELFDHTYRRMIGAGGKNDLIVMESALMALSIRRARRPTIALPRASPTRNKLVPVFSARKVVGTGAAPVSGEKSLHPACSEMQRHQAG
jgi:hypothetical protein